MVSLCLGMSSKSADEQVQFRGRLSELVRAIMTRILEARSVLKVELGSQSTELYR